MNNTVSNTKINKYNITRMKQHPPPCWEVTLIRTPDFAGDLTHNDTMKKENDTIINDNEYNDNKSMK